MKCGFADAFPSTSLHSFVVVSVLTLSHVGNGEGILNVLGLFLISQVWLEKSKWILSSV